LAYIAGHHTAYFSLTTFSAGPTYFNIGSTENGFNHRETDHYEDVVDDAGGSAIADGINQGRDLIVTGTSIEADNINNVLYQGTPLGRFNINVGQTANSLAGTLVLTPVAGTPAAAALGVGMSRVYYAALIINDVEQMLSSKLRKIPVTWRCYPSTSEGWKVWDILSTPAGVSAANPTGP